MVARIYHSVDGEELDALPLLAVFFIFLEYLDLNPSTLLRKLASPKVNGSPCTSWLHKCI